MESGTGSQEPGVGNRGEWSQEPETSRTGNHGVNQRQGERGTMAVLRVHTKGTHSTVEHVVAKRPSLASLLSRGISSQHDLSKSQSSRVAP